MVTQPEEENELSETNRSVRRVSVGIVPRGQSKLSRALQAHLGKKLLQDLHNPDNTTIKRAMVRLMGVWKNGAMAFVKYFEVSHEDTIEGPLWR